VISLSMIFISQMVHVKKKEVVILNKQLFVDFTMSDKKIILTGHLIKVKHFHLIRGKRTKLFRFKINVFILDQLLIIQQGQVLVIMHILNHLIHKNLVIKHGLLVKLLNHQKVHVSIFGII
jgi:hypothetical protein